MSIATRGLGGVNLVTAGLAGSLGSVFATSTAGALALSGALITTFIASPVGSIPTNGYSRRFLGTFFGPKGQGHR